MSAQVIDAVSHNRFFSDSSVDLIWTDPPFGYAKTHRVSSAPEENYQDLTPGQVVLLLKECAVGWRRILKPTGVVCVCLDYKTVHAAAEVLGSELEPRGEIIWHFEGGGVAKKWWTNKHNTILLFTRKDAGKVKFNYNEVPEVLRKAPKPGYETPTKKTTSVWNLSFSTMDPERVQYPSQKPTGLIKPFIEVHTDPGDIVYDPFCGSGSTGVAAEKLGRKSILGDTNPEAVAIANRRIQSVKCKS